MSWIKNTLKTVNKNSKQTKKQKQFGLLLIAVCVIFFIVSIQKQNVFFGTVQSNIAVIVVFIAMIMLFRPKFFYPLLFSWLLLGSFLGLVSSFIVLSIIYYVFLTPIVYLGRLKSHPKSGWVSKKNTNDYEKLF
ncbi:SxtJ family membrane protein [Tenacibaculum halocynthiae]|uniref:SxtJ family membrane protein n=1 Tax=Tenacibaculum halocynthiae TaxID=1254437 RepID=UPI003D65327A